MDLDALRRFAEEQLTRFNLAEQGWTFAFDRARTRFGACRHRRRLITVSEPLARLNAEAACRDTVLHEIAHALAGAHAGHGARWRRLAAEIGARPEPCYSAAEVHQPPAAYYAVCPACGKRTPYYRRPRAARACGDCCRLHSGGAYDVRFALHTVTAEGAPVNAGPPKPYYAGVCPVCSAEYRFARKPAGARACGACCKALACGRFDARFRLRIHRRG